MMPTTGGLGGLNWLRRSFSNSASPCISTTEKDRLGEEVQFHLLAAKFTFNRKGRVPVADMQYDLLVVSAFYQ